MVVATIRVGIIVKVTYSRGNSLKEEFLQCPHNESERKVKKGFVKQWRTRRRKRVRTWHCPCWWTAKLFFWWTSELYYGYLKANSFPAVLWSSIYSDIGSFFYLLCLSTPQRGDSPSIWCRANTVNNIRKKASYFFFQQEMWKMVLSQEHQTYCFGRVIYLPAAQSFYISSFFWMGLDFAYSELAVERVTTLTAFWAVVVCYFS